MTKTAKRRPRWPANPHAAAHALQNSAPFEQAQPGEEAHTIATRVATAAHAALHALCGDQRTSADWRAMAVVCNIVTVRAKAKDIAPAAREALNAVTANAEQALRAIEHRLAYARPSQAAQSHLQALLETHDELLRTSSPLQMHRAATEAHQQQKTQQP